MTASAAAAAATAAGAATAHTDDCGTGHCAAEDADLAARLGGEPTLAALVQQLDLNEKSAAGMSAELRARFGSVEDLAEALPVLKARLQAQRNVAIKAAVAAEVASGAVAPGAATDELIRRMSASNARLWTYLVRQAVAAFCVDEASGDVVAAKEARCRKLISDARPRRRKRATALVAAAEAQEALGAPEPAEAAKEAVAAGSVAAEATVATKAATAAAEAGKVVFMPGVEGKHETKQDKPPKPTTAAAGAGATSAVAPRSAQHNSSFNSAKPTTAGGPATSAALATSGPPHFRHAAARLAAAACSICREPTYLVAGAAGPDDERAGYLRLGCGHDFCARADCGGVLVAKDGSEQRCPLCRVHVTSFLRFRVTPQSFATVGGRLDFLAPAGLEARRRPAAAKLAAAAAARAALEAQREELEAREEARAAALETATCSACGAETAAAEVVVCELCHGGFCALCRGRRALRSQLKGHFTCAACSGGAAAGGGGAGVVVGGGGAGGGAIDGHRFEDVVSERSAVIGKQRRTSEAAADAARFAKAAAIFKSAQERDASARAALLAAAGEVGAGQVAEPGGAHGLCATQVEHAADRQDELAGAPPGVSDRAQQRERQPGGELFAFAHALLVHEGRRLEDFVVGRVEDERLDGELGVVTLQDLRDFVHAGGAGAGRAAAVAAGLRSAVSAVLPVAAAGEAHVRGASALGCGGGGGGGGKMDSAAVAAAFVVLSGRFD